MHNVARLARLTADDGGGARYMDKQPYEPPVLIVEGDVTELTAGTMILPVADITLGGTQ